MLKVTRKAKKLSKKEKITIYDIRQIMAYLGWIDCTDTYKMYEECIKPYVNLEIARKDYLNMIEGLINNRKLVH